MARAFLSSPHRWSKRLLIVTWAHMHHIII
jgi:hypothetical protein